MARAKHFLILVLALSSPPGRSQTVTITDSHPFFRKLEELEKRELVSPSTPVAAWSCQMAQSPFLGTVTGPRREVAVETLSLKLDQPAYYLKDVLSLLEMTETGREDIKQFLGRYQAGQVKVEQMTNEGQRKCPKGTAACYVPLERTLFVDKSTELGVLAPILFHEILHALDGEQEQALNTVVLLKNLLKQKSEEVINRVSQRTHRSPADLGESAFTEQDMAEPTKLAAMAVEVLEVARFRTERQAYDGGFRIEKELMGMFPRYYQTASQKYHFRIPHNFADADIVTHYSMNRSVIERFLRGLCQVVRPN